MSAQESRTTGGWVGQTMRGKYRIVSRLGAGGWGAVYEAEHLLLRRMVAIKVLHPDIAADPRFAERFRREALAASRIGHPNIIEVLDLDRTDDGTEFMVLELLRGESLGEAIEGRGAIPLPTALSIFHQVTSALAAAHRAGIVHRDMKPDNVFLTAQPDGKWFVKLLDFGIAKLDPLFADSQGTITQTGAVLGTPYYMPPEQVRGDKTLDHRADIFSLGVVMYETLAGVPPFEAENLPSLVMKIMFEEPEPLERRRFGVPKPLGALVLRMLAKDPALRPSSCDEILAALALVDQAVADASTDAEETVVGEALGLALEDASMTSRDQRAASDDATDDDNDTMIMASPLLDAEAAEAAEAAPHWPPPLGAAAEVPSIVLSDSIAKALPKRPETHAAEPPEPAVAAPRARSSGAPPAPQATTPSGRPLRATAGSHDPTHVIKTARPQRPNGTLSNAKLGGLVVVAFAGLVTLSYWVVSHL